MSEDLILHLIQDRIKELGYTSYSIRYKDLVVPNNGNLRIDSTSELHYISGDPLGMLIESDYGIYDGTSGTLCDNEHCHKGDIYISNNSGADQRIKFVQVIPQ